MKVNETFLFQYSLTILHLYLFRKLHKLIKENNQEVFESFLDFPKPIIIAANGPAIGREFIMF